jgi:hypothetical protein
VRRRGVLGAGQAEIADRDRPRPVGVAAPVAIGEGVELLDVAEGAPRLPLHPGAQTRLQRAMPDLERPRRQRQAVVDRHHLRPPVGDGDQHGDQFDGDRRPEFFGRSPVGPPRHRAIPSKPAAG